jgi:putative tryptophan/tyrosine transport system substrate-binding protein
VIDRRTFLTGTGAVLLAAPLAAGAHQEGKVYRVGVLTFGPRPSLAPLDSLFNLLQRLRELGYVEGQNLRVEWQSADNRTDRVPQLAAELVRLRVDVIVVPSTQPALAAKQATTTIPIPAIPSRQVSSAASPSHVETSRG